MSLADVASQPEASPLRRRRRVARGATALAPHERLGAFCGVLTLLGSVFAFGAQHTVPLALTSLTACASAWLLGNRLTVTPRILWLFAGLIGYTIFQLIPLPLGVVRVLSPHAAEVWSQAFVAFGEREPGWASLSIDPAATALEVLKWSALPLLLLAALNLRASIGLEPLVAFVFLSATAVALVTFAHGLFGLERIYGVFEPGFTVENWTRGPLLNGNHLAGYVNLGFFSGLGLLLAGRGPVPRPLLLLGTFVLSACTLFSMSRAGLALLGVGSVVFGVFAIRRSASRAESVLVVAGILTALLLVLLVVFGDERLFGELQNRNFKRKMAAWVWSLDLIRDFPLIGVGRGAFETAFQPYRGIHEHDWTVVFSHPENIVVQFLAEWGVLVGGLALVGFGFFFLRLVPLRGALGRVTLGLLLALAVLGLQNGADFSLEVFGVAAAAVVVFAAATPRVEAGDVRRLRLPILFSGTLAIGLGFVIAYGAQPTQVERRELGAEYKALAPRASAAELMKRVRSAVGRHPGEAYYHLLAGLLARRSGQDPLPFLARALERAPVNGTVHLALASILAERGSLSQSLMHLRLAARYDATIRGQALARVASWGKRASVIAKAFPYGEPGGELLADVCPLLRGNESLECLRLVVSRGGEPPAARERLAAALLDAAEAKREPCTAAASCRDEVIALVRNQEGKLGWTVPYLRARAQALDAPPADAAAALLEACPVRPEASSCVDAALRHAERARNLPLLKRVVDRHLVLHCPGSACALAHDRAAGLFWRVGATGQALEQYRLAAREEPNAARWLAVARAAVAIRAASTAFVALDRALSSPDVTEQQRVEAATIRERLATPKE
jgi:tetratricopeptide (TPR) repeat protein